MPEARPAPEPGGDRACKVRAGMLQTAVRRLVRALAGGAAALALSGCLDWSSLYGPRCGDGERGEGEACDDGNTEGGDGCDSSCNLEPPSCGDGRTAGAEECDDANDSNDDACIDGCRAARCGDGQVWLGTEECDDGDTDDGDGCSEACRFEVDRCGDGVQQSPEGCDDGNRVPGDGCSAACAIEPPKERCGDGVVDEGEACDDGNRNNDDGCLNGCSVAACGDGFVRRGVEECDDGNRDNADECTSVCLACNTREGVLFRAANGHCYTYGSKPAGFFGGVASCDASGGFLWTTTSQAEGRDVSRLLELEPSPLWLGFRSDTSPPQWITGESTRYQAWAQGQPEGAPNGCVFQVFDGVNAPVWSTALCAELHPYVCEREPPLVLPNHHAYRLRTAGKDWDTARGKCEETGGHLVVIETEEEQGLLARRLNVEFWIGARRAAQDFGWVTGESPGFTAFAPGEPNGPSGTADCLAFSRNDTWLDADCTLQKRYLCEYE